MSDVAGAMCAYCRRLPVDDKWRPFCSERCKLQDLAHWLSGDYRIPDEPVTESSADEGSEVQSINREH